VGEGGEIHDALCDANGEFAVEELGVTEPLGGVFVGGGIAVHIGEGEWCGVFGGEGSDGGH